MARRKIVAVLASASVVGTSTMQVLLATASITALHIALAPIEARAETCLTGVTTTNAQAVTGLNVTNTNAVTGVTTGATGTLGSAGLTQNTNGVQAGVDFAGDILIGSASNITVIQTDGHAQVVNAVTSVTPTSAAVVSGVTSNTAAFVNGVTASNGGASAAAGSFGCGPGANAAGIAAAAFGTSGLRP